MSVSIHMQGLWGSGRVKGMPLPPHEAILQWWIGIRKGFGFLRRFMSCSRSKTMQ